MFYKFDNEFVKEHADNIFRFAYLRSRDYYVAEELSQEIFFTLASTVPGMDIQNIGGYIHTICGFVWCRYLRKQINKRNREVYISEEFDNISGNTDIASKVEASILTEAMRREIAFLSKQYRDIVILHYYEGCTCGVIAVNLNISESLVKKRLMQIRKLLKDGIENMKTENLNYTPVKLNAGHHGWVKDVNMCGVGRDRLVDNICWACYSEPLTIEQISKKLQVAAAYLENQINKLKEMDYLSLDENGRYRTNFYIRRQKHHDMEVSYSFNNLDKYIKPLYDAFDKQYENIINIGFIGNELEKSNLSLTFLTYICNCLQGLSTNKINERDGYIQKIPKHIDGSEHFVAASLIEPDFKTELTEELKKYKESILSNGIKKRMFDIEDGVICSFQVDWANITKWREFNGSPDLVEMNAIRNIIINNKKPDEMNKVAIAKKTGEGYIEVIDGVPKMLVPLFDKNQFVHFQMICDAIKSELGEDYFVSNIDGFREYIKNEVPEFLSKEEKYHNTETYGFVHCIPYWMKKNGLLNEYSKDEIKRMATMIWLQ